MKNFKNKSAVLFTFFALAFILSLGSCAKKQIKEDIEGEWTMTEFLADGEPLFLPSQGNSMIWTFNDGTLTETQTFQGETETSTSDYKIKDGGKTLWFSASNEWTIEELTSTTLVLVSESNGEVGRITFNK